MKRYLWILTAEEFKVYQDCLAIGFKNQTASGAMPAVEDEVNEGAIVVAGSSTDRPIDVSKKGAAMTKVTKKQERKAEKKTEDRANMLRFFSGKKKA